MNKVCTNVCDKKIVGKDTSVCMEPIMTSVCGDNLCMYVQRSYNCLISDNSHGMSCKVSAEYEPDFVKETDQNEADCESELVENDRGCVEEWADSQYVCVKACAQNEPSCVEEPVHWAAFFWQL